MSRHEESMADQWQRTCQQILGDLEFVQWDRFFETGPQRAKFFGWIDREQDRYKDFVTVMIDFQKEEAISYATSSAKYTEEIADILGMGHTECKRVEDYVHDLDNVVTLESSTEDSSLDSDGLTE